MAYDGQLVLNRRRCGNPGCRIKFWICADCDQRRRYCGPGCRSQARALGHRQANRRYQSSQPGRRNHSARQSRYRARRRLGKNKVTDQDFPTGISGSMLYPCSDASARWSEPAGDPLPDADLLRCCIHCGRPGVAAAAMNGSEPRMAPETQSSTGAVTTEPVTARSYVTSVLSIYVKLPDTPTQATVLDRQQAQRLFARGVPAETVETALLLASLRRLVRDRSAFPLPRVRSLAYFLPVIEELLPQAVRPGYLVYLRRKLHGLTGPPSQPAAQVRP
jgi:hypothetical protein